MDLLIFRLAQTTFMLPLPRDWVSGTCKIGIAHLDFRANYANKLKIATE